MKLTKLLALFLALVMLAAFFTACKKKDKDKDTIKSDGTTQDSEGFDSIDFGDSGDDEYSEDDNSVEVDFITGSVISSGSNADEDTSSGSSSKEEVSSSESSSSSDSSSSSSSSSSTSSTPSDSDSSSNGEVNEMTGYSPWVDNS